MAGAESGTPKPRPERRRLVRPVLLAHQPARIVSTCCDASLFCTAWEESADPGRLRGKLSAAFLAWLRTRVWLAVVTRRLGATGSLAWGRALVNI